MIRHKKKFGIYHWDTFDNTTFLVDECDSIMGAKNRIKKRYGDRITSSGADRVDIVDRDGNVIEFFNIC